MVYSFGYNNRGQLGYLTNTENNSLPLPVDFTERVNYIKAGTEHCLCITGKVSKPRIHLILRKWKSVHVGIKP